MDKDRDFETKTQRDLVLGICRQSSRLAKCICEMYGEGRMFAEKVSGKCTTTERRIRSGQSDDPTGLDRPQKPIMGRRSWGVVLQKALVQRASGDSMLRDIFGLASAPRLPIRSYALQQLNPLPNIV
jgi:hypothetical protein